VVPPDGEEPPVERPKWSITWLLRIQRTGRNKLPPAGMTRGDQRWIAMSRLFQWVVVGMLVVEIALLVWIGVLPR
jgi:hypothetical protein